MAIEEAGKKQRFDALPSNDEERLDDQITPSKATATLNASNPDLYTALGKKFEVPFSVQAFPPGLEKILYPTTGFQKVIDVAESLVRPSAAARAVIEATQKALGPSQEIQALLKADSAFFPSFKGYAAIEGLAKALAPSREIQAVLEATRDMFRPSPEMQRIAAWAETMIRPFAEQRAEFEAMNQILKPSDSLKAMFAVMDTHRSTASLSAIMSGFETLNTSSLFNLLKETDPSTLQSLVEQFESEEYLPDLAEITSISKDVEAEVVKALQDTNGRKVLTPPAIAFLLFFLAAIHTLYDGISKWNDFRESVCDMQQRLGAVDSLASARKIIRGALCDAPVALTQSFRLTKKEGVRLRTAPGIKSEVIMTLPKFAPLEVLDTSDRDWLLVSYRHQGLEIEGWVSRKLVRSASR